MFIISRVFVYRSLRNIIVLSLTPVHENPHDKKSCFLVYDNTRTCGGGRGSREPQYRGGWWILGYAGSSFKFFRGGRCGGLGHKNLFKMDR